MHLGSATMMRMAGVAESRIKRSNYVFGAGVIYCLYAIYACGFDAMVGSAVAVSIRFRDLMFCVKRGIHAEHTAYNKVSIN